MLEGPSDDKAELGSALDAFGITPMIDPEAGENTQTRRGSLGSVDGLLRSQDEGLHA